MTSVGFESGQPSTATPSLGSEERAPMTVSTAGAAVLSPPATRAAATTATPQRATGHAGGGDGLSLPWLADRFYLNLLPTMRSSSSRRSSNDFVGDEDNEGGGYENGPYFSLERLVEVVSGDGWPGIKAAIFGTFSLEMGRLAEQIPSLFSTSNRAIPVLVLHGDKSLLRSSSPEAAAVATAATAATAAPGSSSFRSAMGEAAAAAAAPVRQDCAGQEEAGISGRGSAGALGSRGRGVCTGAPGGGEGGMSGSTTPSAEDGGLAPSRDCDGGGGVGISVSGHSGRAGGERQVHGVRSKEHAARAGERHVEEDEAEEEQEQEEDVEEGGRVGGKQRGREAAPPPRTPEDYFLVRLGYRRNKPGDKPSRVWVERMKAAGRLDRVHGWEFRMPGSVQVEKVDTGGMGVHHPKFGLLFLRDGSLAVFVGTGNMGVDTAIDATWVQRFAPREGKSGGGEGEGEGEGEGADERGKPPLGQEGGGGGGGHANCFRATWGGDFAETLQGFLEAESRLMEAGCHRSSKDGRDAKRELRNFDFSTAAVDLIPTAPAAGGCETQFLSKKQQQRGREAQPKRQQQTRKRRRVSSPSSLAAVAPHLPSDAAASGAGSYHRNSSGSTCIDDRGGGGGGGGGDTRLSSDFCWQGPRSQPQSPSRALSLPLLPISPGASCEGEDGTANMHTAQGSSSAAATTLASRGRSDTSPIPLRSLPLPPENAANDDAVSVGKGGASGRRGAGEGRGWGGVRSSAAVDGRAGEGELCPGGSKSLHDGEGGDGADSDRGCPVEGGAQAGGGAAAASDGDTAEVETVAESVELETAAAGALSGYGQLRMRFVLSKRRRQVEEMGPEDLLILQPTSIGAGIDAGFIEVFAKNLMPDSEKPLRGKLWTESRLDSVRIIWPSMQYIDACREDMGKSLVLRDRQTATTMDVDHTFILGQTEKRPEDDGNGFVFMSPDNFDAMGPDLHACLRTFQMHPATAAALPPRPAHIKSAMRLRRAPPLLVSPGPPTQLQGEKQKQGQERPRQHGSRAFATTDDGFGTFGSSRHKSGLEPTGSAASGTSSDGGDGDDDDDGCGGGGDGGGGGGVCENAQHFAWFLLTSACLSKGAQGEVSHCTQTGTAASVEFKNVELGVLFHSSPARAYHAPPPPDCACSHCRRPRRRCRLGARGHGNGAPPPPLPETQQGGGVESFRGSLLGHRGLAADGTAAAAAAAAAAATPPFGGDGPGRREARNPPQPPPLRRPPLPAPLPVPFCLDSEPYADPEGGSPHARFPPYMHTLKNQRPWSAEVQSLLVSKVKEAQFSK